MKTSAIGVLACALTLPAFAEAAPKTGSAGEKFGSVVELNYTHVAGVRGGAAGGFRGGYPRGGYAGGGYYPRGRYGGHYGGRYGYRYPYYGYGYRGWYGGYYPYWGYYGYPYAAAFAFGAGWPWAYSAGYYAGAAPYVAYEQPVFIRRSRSASASRGSGGSFITGVQSALKTRGYYAGPVDGNFGPASQQAFASFQQASGLPATGTLDQPALVALGVTGKSGKSRPSPVAKPRKSGEATFEPPPLGPPDQPPTVTPEAPATAPATPAAPGPLLPPPIPGGTGT